MIFEHNNYREFLKETLASRVARNPQYSLRSFASQLEVAQSTLCEILKGKKNLSQARALQIAARLKLQPAETDYFCLLVQHDAAKDPSLRAALERKVSELNPKLGSRDLSLDVFKIIADWHHFGILELIKTEGFVSSAEYIGRRLNLTPDEAELALGRLKKVELIKQDEQGVWRLVEESTITSSKIPNSALRTFHRQMLEKALISIEEQSPQEKKVGSETLAFDPADLPEADSIIEEFFARITHLAERGKRRTEVYHAGVQLFRLTEPVQARGSHEN